VLVKDRWVGSHDQVLNVPIRYLCYGPNKPSTPPSVEGGFTPIASMVGLGEKLGTDPQIGQPSCWKLGREPFLLGTVALLIVVDDFAKGFNTQTA
jgi:hypothetical protein